MLAVRLASVNYVHLTLKINIVYEGSDQVNGEIIMMADIMIKLLIRLEYSAPVSGDLSLDLIDIAADELQHGWRAHFSRTDFVDYITRGLIEGGYR